jgi:hypothetical protein
MNGIKRMTWGLPLVVLLLHCMQILSSPDGKVGEPSCESIWDFLFFTFIPVLCMYISLKLLHNLPLYFLHYIPPPTHFLPAYSHSFTFTSTDPIRGHLYHTTRWKSTRNTANIKTIYDQHTTWFSNLPLWVTYCSIQCIHFTCGAPHLRLFVSFNTRGTEESASFIK